MLGRGFPVEGDFEGAGGVNESQFAVGEVAEEEGAGDIFGDAQVLGGLRGGGVMGRKLHSKANFFEVALQLPRATREEKQNREKLLS